MTILVVDDDEAIRETIHDVLVDAGYEVATARNGAEALLKMRKGPPALVLLDLMMPVMDGWEVVRAMRADAVLSQVPVVVLSASGKVNAPPEATFLRKPFSIDALLGLVVARCGSASVILPT